MSLSRKSLTVLSVAILIIASIVLSRVYPQQSANQNYLDQQIFDAHRTLIKTNAGKVQLDSQLVEATNQLAAAQHNLDSAANELPPVGSIEYEQYLFQTATDSGVQISDISFSEMGDSTQGEITFQTANVIVTATGTTGNILTFINNLAQEKNTTLESLDLGQDYLGSGGQGETTLQISLAVFNQKTD